MSRKYIPRLKGPEIELLKNVNTHETAALGNHDSDCESLSGMLVAAAVIRDRVAAGTTINVKRYEKDLICV